MKLLLVADLHYSLRQWDWLVAAAQHFDLVVIAGDLLDITSIVPLEAQIIVVRKYLQRLQPSAPLIVSSGNHDVIHHPGSSERDARWLTESRNPPLYTDGGSFEMEDIHFTILPWWESDAGKDAVEKMISEETIVAKGKRWIWIHHAPPCGSPISWDGHADMGEPALTSWINAYSPEMVLSGHIHQAPFYAKGSWIDRIGTTWVFNGGRQLGSIPTATVIDTSAHTAKWVSLEDAGEALLA